MNDTTANSVMWHGETTFRCPDCQGIVPLSNTTGEPEPQCPDCETQLNHLKESTTADSLPEIVLLCGSTKFKEEYVSEYKRLSKEGYVVLSVGCFGHTDNVSFAETEKKAVDRNHKDKIDIADRIHVINVDGYIGSSTKAKIYYAENTGTEVTYMNETVSEQLIRIPFHTKHFGKILRAEKTGTLRVGKYDIEAGDRVVLCNADENVEWAIAEITHTFTCKTTGARDIFEALNVEHTITNTDESVCEVLQPYYNTPIHEDDTIQGIVWNIVEKFAEPPRDNSA